MAKTSSNKYISIFLRMQPLHRILMGICVSLIVFLAIIGWHLNPWLITSMLWVSFALTFIVTSAVIFFNMPVSEISKRAKKEDGSRFFVFISILVGSFASMFTVLLVMISENIKTHNLNVIVSVAGMMVSWLLVHIIFTFHYAHIYYSARNEKSDMQALCFPGNHEPDYLDFAYFSFVIGMTFQVSDVQVQTHSIRRTVIAHGLLSFVLNTFVVALTINLIAGLVR